MPRTGSLTVKLAFATLLIALPALAASPLENRLAPVDRAAVTEVIFHSGAELDEHLRSTQLAGQPLVVPAAAFHPASAEEGFYFPFANGHVRGEDRACMIAPVQLPHAATVAGVFAFVHDNDVADVFVTLWRKEIASAAPGDALAFLATDGLSTGIQIPSTLTVESPLVDNEHFAYYLSTCLDSEEHRLNAVRIQFVTAESEALSRPSAERNAAWRDATGGR